MAFVTHHLKLLDQACPIPVLKTKKFLAKMDPQDTLLIYATDPHSVPDLQEFCRQTGHRFVGHQVRHEEGVEQFVIEVHHKARD